MPSQDAIFEAKKKFIEKVTNDLDNTFGDLGDELLKTIINEFADKLERDGDQIKNTPANLKLIAAIENIYNSFALDNLPSLASQIITVVNTISTHNVNYFADFATDERKYQATSDAIRKIIQDRLGVAEGEPGAKVQLKKNGYMDRLLKDNTIKNQISDLSYREVMKQQGFQSFKRALGDLITGDKETLGEFQKFYRNYAYDIFVQTDRVESKMYAVELDLTFFIYEGSIIETSRYFCEQNAGKTFSEQEAEQWRQLIGKFKTVPGAKPGTTKRTPIGPIVDDPALYDPIIDLGGLGCRHHPRFISKELAFQLRPELRK